MSDQGPPDPARASGGVLRLATLERELVELRRAFEACRAERQALEEAFVRDPVTGLFNRNRFSRYIRQSVPLIPGGVIIVGAEIDRMGELATRYGAEAVDELVVRTAAALKNAFPEGAMGFRIDTAAFAFVLPELRPDEAYAVTVGVKEAVGAAPLFAERATLSYGLVDSLALGLDEPGLMDGAALVFGRLEELLRQATRRGGDRIERTTEYRRPEDRGRIVLVEPDGYHAEIMTTRLAELGYVTERFSDGERALIAMRGNPPALVISELIVPRIDGLALHRAVQAEERLRDLPFILVSDRKDEASIRESVAQGVLFYLKKPYYMVELLGLVDNLCRKPGACL